LHSLIIERIIEGTQPREKLRTKYIRQIIKDAGITSYRELKIWRRTEKMFESICCGYI
jgi:hypothetical protein